MVDTATYLTGWAMFILSMFVGMVQILRLSQGYGSVAVAVILVLVVGAAGYTVGEL